MAAWKKLGCLSTAILLSALAMPVLGQAAPGGDNGGGGGAGANGGGGGGGGRGNRGGGNFDPAAMRQRMMDQLKTDLGVTDDEMAAIQPKIEAVMTARRDLMTNNFGGMGGGRRGRGGQGGGAAPGGAADPAAAGGAAAPALSPLAQARKDLTDILANKDAPADQIKAKLDAYRDAKKKATDDLTKAQADLKQVLTQRQEAVLVLNGMLD